MQKLINVSYFRWAMMAIIPEKLRAFEAKAKRFTLMASQFYFVKQNANGTERICFSKLYRFKDG